MSRKEIDSRDLRLMGMEEDEQNKLKDLWKVFGMETSLGKQFFKMYNKDK